MNKITIDGEISYWGFSSRWLKGELSEIDGDLKIYLSSYGGDVFEGIDMFNQIARYAKEKGSVTVVVGSKAMSIASLIMMAGTKIKAHKNSTIMIHKAWTWLAGNSDDLEAEARILNGIDTVLAKQYGKRMSESHDEIMELMSKESWYIGEDEIEKTGLVDEFIEDEEEETSTQASYRKAMLNFKAKAQEEDIKPDFENVKKAIVECNDGKCPIENKGVNPSGFSASAKIENSKEGVSMEYTKEKFEALEASHAEALNTVDTKLIEANAKLDETVNAKKEVEEKLAKLQAKEKDLPKIAAMAAERSVGKETLIAMVSAETFNDAKIVMVDNMESGGAYGAGVSDAEKEDAEKVALKERCDKLGVTFVG